MRMTLGPVITISVMGFTQIFSWGATYYLLAILAEPIKADTGWNPTLVAGGLSLGLLVSGVTSPIVGKAIQNYGGKCVLTASSAILAVGLAALSVSSNLLFYFVSWTILGVGMGAGLYDAAFATLTQIYGSAARSTITALTLIAGFSSSICWPLSAYLLEYWGWRGVCLFYAGFHFGICLPLHLMLIPLNTAGNSIKAETCKRSPDVDSRYYALAVVMTLIAVVSAIMSVFLVAMLQVTGMSQVAAVGVAALLGPSQVAVRLAEMLLGRHYHPTWTLVAATGLIASGLSMLALASWQVPAVILYGGGIGIAWVARGTVPLALFGGRDYAILMGRLALPSLIAQAVAPLIGARFLDTYGAGTTLILLLSVALLTLAIAIWLKALSSARPT